MSKAYLLLYNGACGAGWFYCAARAALGLASGASPGALWAEIGTVLTISQTAMLLEIGHSLIGLVPSPVVTVAIQVFSRIYIVWGHTYWVPACQQHWSLYPLILSWGITEVVRYAFYFSSLMGSVPYPLFWLRYSLFMVLYPTGISGEIFQTLVGMGAHWKIANPLWYRLCIITLGLYVPGSPFMILNMWGNRKRSLKKRNAPKVEPEGVAWPLVKNDRSSTATNKTILAAAAGAGPGGEQAKTKVLKEKNWRFAYDRHLLDHVRQSLQSGDGCIKMARAGLDQAHESFQFIRTGKPEISIKKAMEEYGQNIFDTAELKGQGSMPSKLELELQYGGPTFGQPYYKFKKARKTKISGLQLREMLDKWVEYGTIEKDVADALKVLQGNQEKWLDLSDMYFVLLGAASAMGPLLFLLGLGANVIAIARPKALRGIFDQVKASPGKLFFPVKKGTDWQGLVKAGDLDALGKASGCDLMTQAPEIAAWLTTVTPGKQLTIGNYTYLDGALHVQLAVACDCIIQKLCAARKDTAVAFLGTPTDAHVVTQEAAEWSVKAHAKAPLWMKLWEGIGVLKQNKPEKVGELSFINGIVPAQGPNYILAKRMQHWRAMVARADGHIVSSNVSPSTATSSVTSNASFAAGYGGMHLFRPMEVVYQEFALSIMGALLVHDLRNPASASRPGTKLPHPLCLFQATGVHGGLWRCPYTVNTIGIPSALYHYVTTLWLQIALGVAATGAVVRYAAVGAVPFPLPQLLPILGPVLSPLAGVARSLSVPL